MQVIPEYSGQIPLLSTKQMIEVDRAMIEYYGIQLIQMMENAGRNLANLSRKRYLRKDQSGKSVVVMAGTGGNGGGALVCARHLNNIGINVIVVTSRSGPDFSQVPAQQLEIVQKLAIPIFTYPKFNKGGDVDLVIDGLVGYSLKGPPRDDSANLINWANAQDAPILSLDVPSGIDASTGYIQTPAIKASATMTLALPKTGLYSPAGVHLNVGELYLANIGVPPGLYLREPFNLKVPNLFSEGEIIRLSDQKFTN
jgi:NAD(P)H-hydrate epimerase